MSMPALRLFLPCAAGVESWLREEVLRITGANPEACRAHRAGVTLDAHWRDALLLNLHSRLAQRVLVQLVHQPYREEQDLYAIAHAVPWEEWFTPRQSFKIDLTSQHSQLKSLNFAALRIKDALVDRFRAKAGVRPDVDTRFAQVRVFAHLTADHLTLYIDTSGEPLFKRGWREDKGDAPLKETLAAAMLAVCGWSQGEGGTEGLMAQGVPLYDPCCGSGTIAIEAAQMACGMAPGLQRHFGFERLRPFAAPLWQELRGAAMAAQHPARAPVFGSDVSHRMVDFAQRNAQRAGVAAAVNLRGGDALQRMPPSETPGILLLNPPYGERIEAGGVAGTQRRGGRGPAPAAREQAQVQEGEDFFLQLAAHWKRHFGGWTAWMLTPDLKLPGRMRLKESRRTPTWNGPIECRLFRFDLLPPK